MAPSKKTYLQRVFTFQSKLRISLIKKDVVVVKQNSAKDVIIKLNYLRKLRRVYDSSILKL